MEREACSVIELTTALLIGLNGVYNTNSGRISSSVLTKGGRRGFRPLVLEK
jgi:hypothetical protein